MGLQRDFKIRWSVISYLITVDWNSIRLSSFIPSIYTQQMRGQAAKFGPFGNLGSSQRLSSSLFCHPMDFHLFQTQKNEAFLGDGQPLGPSAMIEKRLDLHYRWSHLKGSGTKINHFLGTSKKSVYIGQSARILTIKHLMHLSLSTFFPIIKISPFSPCFISLIFSLFFFPYVLSLNGSILLCGYRDRSWIPFCPPHFLPLAL